MKNMKQARRYFRLAMYTMIVYVISYGAHTIVDNQPTAWASDLLLYGAKFLAFMSLLEYYNHKLGDDDDDEDDPRIGNCWK